MSPTVSKINTYTRKDLKLLWERVPHANPLYYLLRTEDFSPEWFEEFMRDYPKEYELIYVTPLEDLPLGIEDALTAGIRSWRFAIGK